MADGNIEIKFTVEDAQAFRVWQRQQAQAAKLNKLLKDLAKDGSRSSQAISQTALSAMRDIGKATLALTGAGGIGAALQALASQLRAELENIRSRDAASKDTQVEFGKAFAGLQRASGGLLNRRELTEKTLQGAIEAGMDPAEFAMQVTNTLQAKGPETAADARTAIESATTVAQFYPEVSRDERAIMSGSVGDLVAAYKVSTEQSLGLLQNVAQAARVEGPQFMAQNAAPAMAQMAMFGEGPQFAGALFATTTAQTVDREGATSKLIDLKLLERLREAFPEEKTGLKTGQERLAYLQDNPKFQKAFLDGGTILGKKLGEAEIGRSAGRPFLEDLMKKGSASDIKLKSFMNVVGGAEDWQKSHDTVKATVDSDPNMQRGRLEAQGKATVARIQLEHGLEGDSAVMRTALKEIEQATGVLDIRQKMTQLGFDWNTIVAGANPIESAKQALKETSDSLKAPLRRLPSRDIGEMIGISGRYEPDPTLATDKGKADAAQIDRFIPLLDEYAKNIQTRAAESLTEAQQRVESLRQMLPKDDTATQIIDPTAVQMLRDDLEARKREAANAGAFSGSGGAALSKGFGEIDAQVALLEQRTRTINQRAVGAGQQLPLGTLPEAVRPNSVAGEAMLGLKGSYGALASDSNITPQEAEAARKKISEAKPLLESASRDLSLTDARQFRESTTQLIRAIEALIDATNKNTTETAKPPTPGPAPGTSTPAQVPRTPQASRRLDRRYSNIT